MNIITLISVSIPPFLAANYALHLRHKNSALKRIRRIDGLLSFANGNRDSAYLYSEALVLADTYGLIPEDFGYAGYEAFRAHASASLGRYIAVLNEIFSDEAEHLKTLQKQLDSHCPEVAEEYSRVRGALTKLEATIDAARDSAVGFNNPEMLPDLSNA